MLTRRRSFDVNMANLRYKMRNLEKAQRGLPGSRDGGGGGGGGGRRLTLDLPQGSATSTIVDSDEEPPLELPVPSRRRNGVVDPRPAADLLDLSEWVSETDEQSPTSPQALTSVGPPNVPAIVVNEYTDSPLRDSGHQSRNSVVDDSEETPLIQSEFSQSSSSNHSSRPRVKRREHGSSGSLLDLKNMRNVFARMPPVTRSHSGEYLFCGGSGSGVDPENGNLGGGGGGSRQSGVGSGICEPCKLFSSMPDKTKTMSQPSVLHVENEKADYNANKHIKRRGSVQFALPQDDPATTVCDYYPSVEQIIGQRRGSTCSSIPERCSSDATASTMASCAGGQASTDCRIHSNPRSRARARSGGFPLPAGSTCGSGAGPGAATEAPTVTYLQNRRSSRTFTVINYGDSNNNGTRRTSQTTTCGGMNTGGEVECMIDEDGTDTQEDGESACGSMISSASRLQQLMLKQQCQPLTDDIPERQHVRNTSLPSDKSEKGIDLLDLEQQLAYRRKSLKTCTIRSLPDVAKRGALFGQRKKHRLVNKEGDFNIQFKNISDRHKRYLADVFTTLLDMQWRFNLLLFIIAFVVSWVTFAMLWWLIAYAHGDTRPMSQSESLNASVPCVLGITDFTSALLFSIETQHTIGYGVRAMTTSCTEAVVLLMSQSIFGVVIQCVMAGVVLAKLARPKRRGETIMFSHNAIICQEDDQYCLIFRVGDMRRSQLVGAMLHAMFVKKRVTKEGDEIPFYQCHLEVTAESEDYDQFIFLSWPIRIVHRITPTSPLWNMCADGLLTEDFEIIIVLEGVVEATGMCMQVRTSYLPSEIQWGHRLAPLHTVCNATLGIYEIDYAHFHTTIPVSMPEHCANEQHSRKQSQDEGDFDPNLMSVPFQRRRLLSMSESYYGSHAALPVNFNGALGV